MLLHGCSGCLLQGRSSLSLDTEHLMYILVSVQNPLYSDVSATAVSRLPLGCIIPLQAIVSVHFIHYITDSTVRDVIHGFQRISSSAATCIIQPERPCDASGQTVVRFLPHIPGHFAISVLPLFPAKRRLHSFCDKTSRNACNRSAGLLNTIKSPAYITGLLIQFQEYLGMFHAVAGIRPLVYIQYVLHFCHIVRVCFRDTLFLYKPRFDLVFSLRYRPYFL